MKYLTPCSVFFSVLCIFSKCFCSLATHLLIFYCKTLYFEMCTRIQSEQLCCFGAYLKWWSFGWWKRASAVTVLEMNAWHRFSRYIQCCWALCSCNLSKLIVIAHFICNFEKLSKPKAFRANTFISTDEEKDLTKDKKKFEEKHKGTNIIITND